MMFQTTHSFCPCFLFFWSSSSCALITEYITECLVFSRVVLLLLLLMMVGLSGFPLLRLSFSPSRAGQWLAAAAAVVAVPSHVSKILLATASSEVSPFLSPCRSPISTVDCGVYAPKVSLGMATKRAQRQRGERNDHLTNRLDIIMLYYYFVPVKIRQEEEEVVVLCFFSHRPRL